MDELQRQALAEVTEFSGSKGDRWVLDESLRERAEALVEKFSDDLSHVQLQHVVFLRVVGASSSTWYGKCQHVGRTPNVLIPRYIMMKLGQLGMLDLTQLRGIEAELLDLRYIITINDTAIQARVGSGPGASELKETLEVITLYHELLHIPPGMLKGCVGHDRNDFAKVLHRFGVFWADGIVTPPGEALASSQDAQTLVRELLDMGITSGGRTTPSGPAPNSGEPDAE